MNIDNAKLLLDDLIENTEDHDQSYWLTKYSVEGIITGCAAGRAVLLADAEPDWFENFHGTFQASCCEYRGERKSIHAVADEWLGLTDEESYALFIECYTEESAVYYLGTLIEQYS